MGHYDSEHQEGLLQLARTYELMVADGHIELMSEQMCQSLIDFYEVEGQLDRAIDVAQYAIQHYQYSVDFKLRLAQLYLEAGREDDGLAVLDHAEYIAPAEIHIYLLRAESYVLLDDPYGAFEAIEKAKSMARGSLMAEVLVVESMIYESREDFLQMYQTLKAALQIVPNHLEALERILAPIEYLRNYEASVQLHEALLEEDAYAYLAWFNLGHAQAYLGNYELAIEAFEYAYLINPNFEIAYREYGDLCFELRQYRRARRCYEEMREQFEADADLYAKLGNCYLHENRLTEARKNFFLALQQDPLNDEILHLIGTCYAQQENWRQAIAYYRRAISIEDACEAYYVQLAEAYFHAEAYQLAETNFIKAIQIAPEEPQAWIQLIMFLMTTDQQGRAFEIIDQAQEQACSAELTYCRIACLMVMGRRQEALYWLGEALQEDFDAHQMLFELVPELETDPDVIRLLAIYAQ